MRTYLSGPGIKDDELCSNKFKMMSQLNGVRGNFDDHINAYI